MEILGHNPRKELFVAQLLLMEVIDEQQDLNHINLDVVRLEGAHLGAHLRLQQLEQDGQEMLVLASVASELGHDLTRQYNCAFAQSVLHVRGNFKVGHVLRRVERVVAQVDEAANLQVAEETAARLFLRGSRWPCVRLLVRVDGYLTAAEAPLSIFRIFLVRWRTQLFQHELVKVSIRNWSYLLADVPIR